MSTIVEKLKLNNYVNKTILNQPAETHYFDTLEQANLCFTLNQRVNDLVIVFTYSKEDFITQIKAITATQKFESNGYLFVAYPKIGNKQGFPPVHRDEIFPALGIDPKGDGYLGDTLFKFSRMVSLDETFTIVGLKYVTNKKTKQLKDASSNVADYQHYIPAISDKLTAEPDVLALYTALTPGYQRNWARYIYSAKQLPTQEKRYHEMLALLRAGYKSKDLYQKEKRANP